MDVDVRLPLRSFDLELAVEVGRETLAVVGPSGAGKSSVLRCVAGLARPSRGRIAVDGETWFDSERGIDRRAEDREVGFVFQDYALFPHLSVERNVSFARRDGRALLDRLGIAHLAHARPRELSGGERQRVAIARALAREPRVLLLDEPLSALDAHTRGEVRAELRELLAELRLPTLLVTHDFEDAAALCDRVGVLVDGKLLQLGTPTELVASPASPFVATFTGANVLRGRARAATRGLTEIELEDGGVVYSVDEARGDVGVVVDPWEVSLALSPPDDSALNHVAGEIVSVVALGARTRVRIGALTAEITTASSERLALAPGGRAVATFKATATRLVPLGQQRGSR